jgi:Zn-dependent protease
MDGLNLSRIIQDILLVAPGFLLAITVHESAHGFVAYKFGDPTAKQEGRLTFNPLSHLDPVGTLVLILTRTIGWAKPVPVNPRYFKNPRRDMLWVSLAGPAANLIAAIALVVLLHLVIFIWSTLGPNQTSSFFFRPFALMLSRGVFINVVLAVFNIIPVPPLDGSKILSGLLPLRQAYQFEKLEPYGFIILMALIFTNAINYVITPPIQIIFNVLMTGLM